MKNIGRLHLLTDTVLQSRYSHIELTKMGIKGGADTVQFRQKSGSAREMIAVAREMRQMCKTAGVTFIVNDRVDIAIASDADGVHLGQDDFPIPMAREVLGSKRIIGGSASNMDEARKCVLEGADYVGFGPVYPTTSKDDAGPVSGIAVLEQIVRDISLPVIAIGGINAQNTAPIMKAGAFGISVISTICCQDDPEQATRNLYQALHRALGDGHV